MFVKIIVIIIILLMLLYCIRVVLILVIEFGSKLVIKNVLPITII